MISIAAKTITAQLKSTNVLSVNISAGSAGGGDFTGEVYDGPYEVRPGLAEQVLDTGHKYMTQDVNVQAIPYSEVSNIANGITATIG